MADLDNATDLASAIKSGYTFDGATIDVGALLADGQPHPDARIRLPLAMMNRHGLVAGATGTGKTRTLQGLAEQLSDAGVAVFLADMKGDLSGLAVPGKGGEKLEARTEALGQDWKATGYPVEFLCLGGLGDGVPVRATPTSFGPTLLSKVLELNPTQSSCLELIFRWADERGYELLDLKDVRAVVAYLTSAEGKNELKELGGVSAATAGVILRELSSLAARGAEVFFGEPEFDVSDIVRTAPDGRGVISVLELPAVQEQPELFSTFLMWLLADLFEALPEVGDTDKPKLVFFFDEAHLLFNGAPKPFLESVTKTVRLIRSKGVGVFFVTQTPTDVPSDVLAQLANRIQHALRAYTPNDAKALKATVSTFPKTTYDLAETLTSLGIGEAVVTVMSEDGVPTPVAPTRLFAPQSEMGPMDETAMRAAIAASPLTPRYGQSVDNESAYERLERAQAERQQQAEVEEQTKAEARPRSAPKPAPHVSPLEAILGQKTAHNLATAVGKEIARSLFGTRKRR
ncbi:MAG TPA: helicase HerA-like domain-containing protein [Actinospica sp.]|jgi:DNA helicase HerA-like ATPase|nr:helicase HerA-like domain-containing protein [Actinospica sp.]